MDIQFDTNATPDSNILEVVRTFLESIETQERISGKGIVIQQDGVTKSYFVRCGIAGITMAESLDLDARLDPSNLDSFRANRELLLTNNTFKRMIKDAESGREFNDIIAEYNTSYNEAMPLKVWGGQHRSKAIENALHKGMSRNHGFRVYFALSKLQRGDLAFISNTNINVSNDLFDRQLEETIIGPNLRKWAESIGLLEEGDDFPDAGGKSEKITVRAARSFVVNYFMGTAQAATIIPPDNFDRHFYEPYLAETGGLTLDPEYEKLVESKGDNLWKDPELHKTGKAYASLHFAQYAAIAKSNINRKSFRNKSLGLSLLPSWAFIAGLLHNDPERLNRHLAIPKPPKGIPDPLNAEGMSKFKHDQDPPTYRGLGTRAAVQERIRLAQVFLARTVSDGLVFDRKLMTEAVSTAVGLRMIGQGYSR